VHVVSTGPPPIAAATPPLHQTSAILLPLMPFPRPSEHHHHQQLNASWHPEVFTGMGRHGSVAVKW